jgi:predicted kinase
MIIAMAGLPGVGKSTLAGALSVWLDAVVLDKDLVRASLFPPSRVDYTRDQDDFCVDVMYRTAGWLLCRNPATIVILDGRNYARADQVATLRQLAVDLGVPLRIIECRCDDELALARIEQDRATARHPAADRDPALYRRVQAVADPIDPPKLVVDTGRSIAACLADCLAHLAGETGQLG